MEIVITIMNNKDYYRRQCIVIGIDGEIYDFTGEFDMYLQECNSPEDAYNTVFEEFINK